tara:strand:- start:67885 stop:69201 length:1317 start_codon:yes stop_codon:yes gene_type:complete
MNLKIQDFLSHKKKIGVLGLGYVGLPLAVCLAQKFEVVGYDVDKKKISNLQEGGSGLDILEDEALKEDLAITFTDDKEALGECALIIVAVPTPIDKDKKPELSFLKAASAVVAKTLQSGSVVVFESTVYPGVTEDECRPILEKESGLTWQKDFFLGYSPERINPGDKAHSIEDIVKVVAGDTDEVRDFLAAIYGEVISAGVFKATSIKTAEAAKVIENIQRDLNIALMNELAIIFDLLGLDTAEVLEAAATKWNFIPFKPGLVGGHCIGVDPYYLTHIAGRMGHYPEVILSGRSINDGMGKYVANQLIKELILNEKQVKGASVLVLGFAFKENVSDVRNTKVIDLVSQLIEYGVQVDVYDPLIDAEAAKKNYGLNVLMELSPEKQYDGVALAVAHASFRDEAFLPKVLQCVGPKPVFFDIPRAFPKEKLPQDANLCTL